MQQSVSWDSPCPAQDRLHVHNCDCTSYNPESPRDEGKKRTVIFTTCIPSATQHLSWSPSGRHRSAWRASLLASTTSLLQDSWQWRRVLHPIPPDFCPLPCGGEEERIAPLKSAGRCLWPSSHSVSHIRSDCSIGKLPAIHYNLYVYYSPHTQLHTE